MAYADLIAAIFIYDDQREVASEVEFLRALPNLLNGLPTKRNRWTGEMFARLLAARFELGGAGKKTLKECGDEFDVTPGRIRQVEAKLLRRLRHPLVVNKYAPPNASLSGAPLAARPLEATVVRQNDATEK